MAFEKGARRLASRVRARHVVLLLAGVLAGYSVGVVGETVVLPVVGSVSGTLFGASGLLVAAVAYHQSSCCDDCGERGFGLRKDCGCTDDCGDSCSVDP